MKETNKKKDDIIEKIKNISAVSEEVVATLGEFGNSAVQLNELVKVLETEISKFKL